MAVVELVDGEGRLFGLVNVVDAVFVLLVVSVVVAGAALVFGGGGGGGSPDLTTRYATLDLGAQPDYLVAALDEGDSYEPTAETNLTITDVHLAPQGDRTRVILRVRLRGPESEGSLSYDGAPPRLGRDLAVRTDTYAVMGTIRDVGDRAALRTAERSVVLRTTLSPADSALRPGQAIRIANRTVATVDDVRVYEANASDRRVAFVRATLRTYVAGDTPRFGGTVLAPGSTLGLLPGGDATVRAVGAGFETGTTAVVVTDTVGGAAAAAIDPGDRYRVAGRDVATVDSVAVYGTANPDEKRVRVGLTLHTLDFGDRPQFGTVAIREGATVPFRTEAYDLAGTVQRVGTTEPRGEPATRTVTLRMRGVAPDLAESVREGMTESAAGTTIARLTDVERAPSTVVLTSDGGRIYERDHPVNVDLTVTADLAVRETSSGITFKGEVIQQGSTVVLDLGEVTVEATVVAT